MRKKHTLKTVLVFFWNDIIKPLCIRIKTYLNWLFSARWERVNDRLGSVFGFFSKVLIFVFFAWCFICIRKKVKEDSYTIYPFSVPKQLQDLGITGDILAEYFKKDMTDIQNFSPVCETVTFNNDEKNSFKVEVSGFSLEASFDFIASEYKTLRGIKPKYIKITIDLSEDSVVSSSTIINSDAAHVYQSSIDFAHMELNTATFMLVRQTAMQMTEIIAPARLANFYGNTLDYNSSAREASYAYDMDTIKENKILDLAIWSNALESLNKHDEALEKIKWVEKLDSTSESAVVDLLFSLITYANTNNAYDSLRQDYPRLMTKCENFVKAHPKNIMPLNNMAILMEVQGDTKGAKKNFKRVLEDDSLNYYALCGLPLLLAQEHDFANATIYLDRFNYYNMGKGDKPLASGILGNQIGGWIYDSAVIDFAYAHPDLKYGWVAVGDVYYKNRNYDSAVVYYKRAIDLDKKFNLAWLQMGKALWMLNLYELAGISFKNAVESTRSNTWAYFYWAQMLEFQGDYLGALDKMNTAIFIDKYNPEFNAYVGYLSGKLGRNKDAYAYFTYADIYGPYNSGAIWFQRLYFEEHKDYKRSLNLINRLVEIRGYDLPLLNDLLTLYTEQNKMQDAARIRQMMREWH